jgi:hypothetical protein
MPRIERLYWDEDNVNHLAASHRVTPEEVEEALIGLEGEEEPFTLQFREPDKKGAGGEYYRVYGETGDGRLLSVIGAFVERGVFYPFGANDMTPDERRVYRRKKR